MKTHKEYLKHLDQSHAGKRLRKCARCEELFETDKELWTHRVGHRKKRDKSTYRRKNPKDRPKPKLQVCDICGVETKNMASHYEYNHKEEEVLCKECGHVSKNKTQHHLHVSLKHEKVPCQDCGKMFAKKHLKTHIQQKHTSIWERRYKCDICGKGFVTNRVLLDHRNVHTGEKPHACNLCSARFASRANMYAHMKSHRGIKRRK